MAINVVKDKDKIVSLGKRWKNDPVVFAKESMNIDLVSWQKELAESVLTEDRISVRSAHGVGKSFGLSVLAMWWMLTREPAVIACTAPSAHQLEDILWSQIYELKSFLLPELQELVEIGKEKITISDKKNCYIVARTARQEKPDAFQGFHSANMLLLVDEASGVADKIFEVGAGAMSTKGAKTIMTGNPTRTTGYFYKSFHENSDSWYNIKVSAFDSPTVDQKYIDFIAKEYGEDSDPYRVRVLGEFPESDSVGIIKRAVLMNCVENTDIIPYGDVVWGVDPARGGGDRCALAKRKENAVIDNIYSHRYPDTMDFADYIYQEYAVTEDNEKPVRIFVDVVGMGGPILDRLKRMGLPAVGVHPQDKSARNDCFKKKDELIWKMKRWFERGYTVMTEDMQLIKELTTVRGTFSDRNGLFTVESKDEYKQREGKSPDLVDALALTFQFKPVFQDGIGGEEYANDEHNPLEF